LVVSKKQSSMSISSLVAEIMAKEWQFAKKMQRLESNL
jgi:hypothetical protein